MDGWKWGVCSPYSRQTFHLLLSLGIFVLQWSLVAGDADSLHAKLVSRLKDGSFVRCLVEGGSSVLCTALVELRPSPDDIVGLYWQCQRILPRCLILCVFRDVGQDNIVPSLFSLLSFLVVAFLQSPLVRCSPLSPSSSHTSWSLILFFRSLSSLWTSSTLILSAFASSGSLIVAMIPTKFFSMSGRYRVLFDKPDSSNRNRGSCRFFSFEIEYSKPIWISIRLPNRRAISALMLRSARQNSFIVSWPHRAAFRQWTYSIGAARRSTSPTAIPIVTAAMHRPVQRPPSSSAFGGQNFVRQDPRATWHPSLAR